MISLYVDKGVAYVWNSEDWNILRSNHRICGALIGSVASFPRQNDFQGLPMALMSEEAALLVEKGICQLVELPHLNYNTDEKEKEKLQLLQNKQLEEQHEALRKRKIEQITQKIDIILAGKKQKMLSKGIKNVNLNREALLQEEIEKLSKVAPAHMLVHLPTEHYTDTVRKYVKIDVLCPSVLEPAGASKFAIFKDLWGQGYYITSGSKFGSNYLVYPGDPVRFHAMYMVKCVETEKTFKPREFVAFGRLSVAVNKMAVLAFHNTYGKVEYQTLQWHDSLYG
ncbi:tRNA-splicing endonuclease subunit Sen34 [Aricia agestis]|uniref:tRNA-splicing endonuclease subunit Sen34 n=1 Tax=Aricia agestis TaxID=91739 RepID=UPI001C209716|nr:tRNA-splicing endonuclease subunit Sen34 [Aricia agestis]